MIDKEIETMKEIEKRLSDFLGQKADGIYKKAIIRESPTKKYQIPSSIRPDGILKIGDHQFLIEYKSSSSAGLISQGIHQLERSMRRIKNDIIPLLVVPYMGKVGRDLTHEAQISWMDLSGNATIVAPGLIIHVEGKPNQFKRVGRPMNVFAPKSSRIARTLLIHNKKPMTQRGIALASDMDEGFTSRIIRRLEDQNLAERYENILWRAKDPDLLLDEWYNRYDFEKHTILRGHVAARSGFDLLSRIVDLFQNRNIEYAVTGLAGAWLYDRFSDFRITTCYLKEQPSDSLLDGLGFHEEQRGSNLWLVLPNDYGVFHGQQLQQDIYCVHQVQVYLDLKAHPERAQEAAEELRRSNLKWDGNG